ncbi:MAG: class I SAM-dependent methyltransferase [bacterium]
MQHLIYKKLFGPEAKNYTKYRTPYPKELFDLLVKSIPKGSVNVLDIACGTGKSTEDLVATALKVSGVDHDEQMIEEARVQAEIKNLEINYSVADVEHLPFPDQHFDVVTVGTAFHFFMNEPAMSEIKRVLKQGGLLFVYWTLTTKDIPDEDSIPGSIFKKYKWVKVPSELRDLGNVSNFFSGSCFQKVSTERITVTYNTTVEERVGLQTTSGFYETLSEEDKKHFLTEVRDVLTKNLGSRAYFTLEEEIQVCLGFKG